MSKAQRTIVQSAVRVGKEVRTARFIASNGKFSVSSRGVPRLRLRADTEHDEVVVRATYQGVQSTLRVKGQDLAKAFDKAVHQFWTN